MEKFDKKRSGIRPAKADVLLKKAMAEGAGASVMMPPDEIRIDSELAVLCRTPGCGNFGLARSCPPHVEGPEFMKDRLESILDAVFFKINVPSDILLSNERFEVFRLLHEIGSKVEKEAKGLGFVNSTAYAGGSCKKIFCDSDDNCRALSEKSKCRYPDAARPSMSGFGFDVSKLMASAGWEMTWIFRGKNKAENKMACVCGLVLIQ